MNSFIKAMSLAACLLSAAGSAAAAGPAPKDPGSLFAAPAKVVSVNQASHIVVLKVWSTGFKPVAFQIDRACLFSGGLVSSDNLFPDERVLIWTQGGQAGRLPSIVRVDRAQN